MSFSELFNPGMKHLREEQQRKRIEAQIPESEGDPLRDFEQGIIRIIKRPAPSEPLRRRDPAQPDPADTTASDQTED